MALHPPALSRAVLALLLGGGLVVAGCQGPGLSRGMQRWLAVRPPLPSDPKPADVVSTPATTPGSPEATPPPRRDVPVPGTPTFAPLPLGTPSVRGRVIRVGEADLRAVDHFVGRTGQAVSRQAPGLRRARWIVADHVDIVASTEYFSQVLSVNRGPFVQRTDRKLGNDALITLRYLGDESQRSAMNNPRVQVGPDLMVQARRILRVRMVKTRDPRAPIRLQVNGYGAAHVGAQDQPGKEHDRLSYGGFLARQGNRWVWRTFDTTR